MKAEDLVSPGLIGFAVEFTWAAQEAVIIPYLQFLGLPLEYSGISYILNPIFGIFLQPYIGSLSDKYGRRKPFVAVLAVSGACGLVLLLFSYEIGHFLFHASNTVVIILALLGMAISDISHDCLLVPARAMVQDLAKNSTVERNRYNANFSKLQVLGRLLSLLLGAFSIGRFIIPEPIIHTLPEGSGPLIHMMALAVLAIFVLFTMSTLVLMFLPSEETFIFNPDPSPVATPMRNEETPLLTCGEGDGVESYSTESVIISPLLAHMSNQSREGVLDQPESSDDELDSRVPYINMARAEIQQKKRVFRIVLLMHFYGWICSMVQNFYWTAFLEGERITLWGMKIRISFLGLALGALVSFLASFQMAALNRKFGALRVYIAGELTFMVSLLLLNLTGTGAGTLVVGGLSGLFYVIHVNNPFVILHAGRDDEDDSGDEDDDHPSSNAWIVGLISASLPAAQIVVGSCAGFILELLFAGNFVTFFTFFGILGIFLDGLCLFLLNRIFHSSRQKRSLPTTN